MRFVLACVLSWACYAQARVPSGGDGMDPNQFADDLPVAQRGNIEWQLNPLWARLEKEEYEEYGIARLFLVSRGKQLTIGSFLGPDEKAGFAEELTRALGEARRGPVRTAFSQA